MEPILEIIFTLLMIIVQFLGPYLSAWIIMMMPVYVMVGIVVFRKYHYLKLLRFWVFFIFLVVLSLCVLATAMALGAWG